MFCRWRMNSQWWKKNYQNDSYRTSSLNSLTSMRLALPCLETCRCQLLLSLRDGSQWYGDLCEA